MKKGRKDKGKAIAPHKKKRKEMPFVDYYSGQYRQPSLHIRESGESGTLSDRRGRDLVDTSSDEEDMDLSTPFVPSGTSSQAARSSVRQGDMSHTAARGETSQSIGRASADTSDRTGDPSIGRASAGTLDRTGDTSIGRDYADTPDGSGDISAVKRRGEARVRSPPRTGKKSIQFLQNCLVAEDMAGLFRPLMRKQMNGFYPQWSDVPRNVRGQIWERFLEEYSLENFDYDLVYQKFMEQNGDKYRKFLHELKRKYIKKYKVKDVAELIDKPKPDFMKSDSIWKEYVRHWSSPEQRGRSQINIGNRAKLEGRSHGYGRKSAPMRLLEMKKEGKTPSMLNVMAEVNMKRDEKRNPTGQFHHPDLQDAIAEYRIKHKETHGPDANPDEDPFDFQQWTSTSAVSRRISQGRVLGIGTCKKAANLFAPSKNVGVSSEVQSRLDELQQKYEEESLHRKRIEEEAAREVEVRKKLEAQVALLMQTVSSFLPAHPLVVPEVPPAQTPHPLIIPEVPPIQTPKGLETNESNTTPEDVDDADV